MAEREWISREEIIAKGDELSDGRLISWIVRTTKARREAADAELKAPVTVHGLSLELGAFYSIEYVEFMGRPKRRHGARYIGAGTGKLWNSPDPYPTVGFELWGKKPTRSWGVPTLWIVPDGLRSIERTDPPAAVEALLEKKKTRDYGSTGEDPWEKYSHLSETEKRYLAGDR